MGKKIKRRSKRVTKVKNRQNLVKVIITSMTVTTILMTISLTMVTSRTVATTMGSMAWAWVQVASQMNSMATMTWRMMTYRALTTTNQATNYSQPSTWNMTPKLIRKKRMSVNRRSTSKYCRGFELFFPMKSSKCLTKETTVLLRRMVSDPTTIKVSLMMVALQQSVMAQTIPTEEVKEIIQMVKMVKTTMLITMYPIRKEP